MTATATGLWLTSYLEPLAPFLARPDVTDIWINRPGEVWIETLGGGIECLDVPLVTETSLTRLIRQIAAASAQAINRAHPILSASLPSGERVQAIMPPATRGHIAFVIRKFGVSAMRLDDYEQQGAFDTSHVIDGAVTKAPSAIFVGSDNPMQLLRDAVRARRNILVSGGTSSGKTTFLNALLAEVPAHERLILIEDTPELKVSHGNLVGLLAVRGEMGEAAVTPEELLIASLRMRPDRIILGEIRGSEAATFLRAVNTGHPGSLSTIHADSAIRAIDQLALLVLQTGIRMTWEDVVTYVKRSLDVIVQLERVEGRRKIAQILFNFQG